MIDSVKGVILAGGQSTRMGKNKALLPYQGKTFLAVSIEKLSSIFTEVLLSVRDPDESRDEDDRDDDPVTTQRRGGHHPCAPHCSGARPRRSMVSRGRRRVYFTRFRIC